MLENKFPPDSFPVDAVLNMFDGPKQGAIFGVNGKVLCPFVEFVPNEGATD